MKNPAVPILIAAGLFLIQTPFALPPQIERAARPTPHEECTTAVIPGTASIDGRPLLWKNRDTSAVDNEVVYFPGVPYQAVGVVDADSTDYIWMGINSAGFAIENAYAPDLEGNVTGDNGIVMKHALLNCATVDEFERLLIDTNGSGRGTQSNYGVIDASGGAAVFETGNHTYTRFDAGDPAVAPDGFLVRTNFGFTGDGSGGGYERYERARELLIQGTASPGISHEYFLKHMARDLKTEEVDPYPLPYGGSMAGMPTGFIRTVTTINRYTTRSSVVFQGVLPGEDPRLSTMWVILGEPVCSFAVPLWILAGETPAALDGPAAAPLCDAAEARTVVCYPDMGHPDYLDTFALDNGGGGGLLALTRPLEDWVFDRTAAALDGWRAAAPTAGDVREFEYDLIGQAFACYIYGAVPSERLFSPLAFTCRRIENRALLMTESLHELTWEANPENGDTAAYRIYHMDGGNAVRLAELAGTEFRYWHRSVESEREYTYILLPVDGDGIEGNPALIYRYR